MTVDTLFYDGRCPLCSAEMDKLERHAQGRLALVDIHCLPEDRELPDKKELLGSLHLKKANGEMLSGLDANVAAWQHTRFGVFFRWLRWPAIKVIADSVYTRWAKKRYSRLYECR